MSERSAARMALHVGSSRSNAPALECIPGRFASHSVLADLPVNIYESTRLRKVTGSPIRPGGYALTERGVSFCGIPEGSLVLDAGCGEGATVEYLKDRCGLKPIGIDISELLLEEARRKKTSGSLVRADASRLPVRDSIFSAVFCECVLSLTPDPTMVLAEFFRTLNPGGFLVVTDIYSRANENAGKWEGMTGNCCLKGAVSEERIRQNVSDAGFAILALEDHSNLLKILAAQMVFAYGSMKQFWSSFCDGSHSSGWLAESAEKLRPGYYFLAAKKV